MIRKFIGSGKQNIFSSRLAILNSAGQISHRNNWLKTGWVNSHSQDTETVLDLGNEEGDVTGIELSYPADNYFFSSYPNPFKTNTTISYDLPNPSQVNRTIREGVHFGRNFRAGPD